MRFLLTDEQRAFGDSLDAMLTSANAPAAARAWAAGDPAPGLALWSRLAEAGVFALAAPEAYEGVGPLPVELVVAFAALGRHAVPGPVVETVAAAALLTRLADSGEAGPAKRLLPGLVTGESTATLAIRGRGPYALDADVAGMTLVVSEAGAAPGPGAGPASSLRIAPGHGPVRVSADPARRLAVPAAGGEVVADGVEVARAAAYAGDVARLVTAAQALGVGLALLDRTVAYVKQRTQFGVPVGSFQAVKHRLADTLIGLEFARPLLYGAALSMATADIAAAKVTAGEAAYAAARAALQLHGAVGYTDEFDLSLWLRKARPLRDAWGTPAHCRARVLAG
ncbi:alkylation response protein AidB-like acyl-CoA dehydrogenase [Streptomyces sp. SLBN-118]|uniref:acyl-CoA dehydrogenase family protein n=1 Tax=Streptomyces sp. SLBN-118 TaxID=2768454 RepID=UPI001150FA55|nr:acyl-CoA dehydrogenase family protein [Streptomyces sp. SLBN-118]TQK43859.1 alkylation response protein AidB-like acyl-CoA dehydrogenase [Streptomyces sp. SLBN-118]